MKPSINLQSINSEHIKVKVNVSYSAKETVEIIKFVSNCATGTLIFLQDQVEDQRNSYLETRSFA